MLIACLTSATISFTPKEVAEAIEPTVHAMVGWQEQNAKMLEDNLRADGNTTQADEVHSQMDAAKSKTIFNLNALKQNE